MTETGGPAWRQTIFYPFAQLSTTGAAGCCARTSTAQLFARATTIRAARPDLYFPVTAPYLKLAAVQDDDGSLTLFALNRHLEEAMPLDVRLPGLEGLRQVEAVQLVDADLDAANTRDDRERVVPSPLGGARLAAGQLRVELAPASWNMIRLSP